MIFMLVLWLIAAWGNYRFTAWGERSQRTAYDQPAIER
jgi:hypothetical protein